MALFLTLITIGISYLFTAFCVWAIIGLLSWIGIVTIGSFALVFSWKLVTVVYLILAIVRQFLK